MVLNEVIEEYCNITKRPVSTITVSEYIEFRKFCTKKDISEVTIRDGIPQGTLNFDATHSPNHETLHDIVQPLNVYKEQKNEEKKNIARDKESALAILRSVSG